MQEFAQKQIRTDSFHPIAHARSPKMPGQTHDANPLAREQAMGNQAVQRMLRFGAIQAKLTVNEPGDKYEQEADRIAEQVMSMPEPGTIGQNDLVQRKCPECEEEEEKVQSKPIAAQITPLVLRQVDTEDGEEKEELQTKPLAGQIMPLIQRQAEPEEEEEEKVQAKSLDGSIQREEAGEEEKEEVQAKPLAAQIMPLVQRQAEPKEEDEEMVQREQAKPSLYSRQSLESQIRSFKGRGQPIPGQVRAFFEPRFRNDFSQVQVHTGAEAAETARSINARAFTVGHDIVFGTSQYDPTTVKGKRLLAHELTHFIQQSNDALKDNQNVQPKRRNKKKKRKTPRIESIKKITFDGRFVTVYGIKSTLRARAVSGLLPNHKDAKGVDFSRAEYQNIPDKGPIPEGDYYINPSEAQTAKKGGFDPGPWGYYRTPIHETVLRRIGRWLTTSRKGGFYLHQDANNNGTGGCIGLLSHKDNKIIYLRIKATKNEIPIEVHYPQAQANQKESSKKTITKSARIACACSPSTMQYYDDKTFQFIKSIEPLVNSIAGKRGIPTAAVAGAIADEYNTRRGFSGLVDSIQDSVIDSIPEIFIDVDRFFDIHKKLLNTLENDIGPANIKVRTALEMVQRGELAVPGSPSSNIKVNKIIDFLLTERGTVAATTAVIARAQRLFSPHTKKHGRALSEAVFVEYFKQGDKYYNRFSESLAANPYHKVCPGDGGCRFSYNYGRIKASIKSR